MTDWPDKIEDLHDFEVAAAIPGRFQDEQKPKEPSFQQKVCEFSDDPLNKNHPICGKPATHFMYGLPGPPDAFPMCEEHFKAMAKDAMKGKTA